MARPLPLAACLLVATLLAADAPAQVQTGPPLPFPVLYTRIPSVGAFPGSFDNAIEFIPGTNLVLRLPNGAETNLTNLTVGAAKDPDLRFAILSPHSSGA